VSDVDKKQEKKLDQSWLFGKVAKYGLNINEEPMRNDSKYVQMTVIMKAMANPTRLFILDMLKEKEQCVCELQAHIGLDMSTVSKHLSVLKQAGIISSRKHNNQVFYSLLCPCVLDFYSCMRKMK